MAYSTLPPKQGLYDPANEHDACGVGFVANIKGARSHAIIEQGLQILKNLTHRGAVGADPMAGDGAGILIQLPDQFFREEMAARRTPENPELVLQANDVHVADVEEVRGPEIGREILIFNFEADYVGVFIAARQVVNRGRNALSQRIIRLD